jgi:micrococcal nuclease
LLRSSRYIYLYVLIIMIVFWVAGCASTPQQGEPEGPGQQVQQEDQAQPNSAEGTLSNRGNQPEETKGQDNNATPPARAQAPALLPATITYVVDGDTVHVTLSGGKEEKVRFIGVDTPESTSEVEPYGKEASAYTKSRLDGRRVWLELDVEERDRYGRLLAYIWLEQPTGDGEAEVRAKMYNAELLLSGYAQVMTIPPNVKYADLFVELQREAREVNKGMWGKTTKEEAREVGDYYLANTNSKKFHRPDCKWGKKIFPANLAQFGSANEALNAGYEPCKVCKP